MALALVSLLIVVLLLLVVLLWLASPGTPRPIIDEQGRVVHGSLADKTFIDVHGTRQGMFIKSRDAGHPVLLYLHGGMPDYFLDRSFPSHLEDQFTVAWWEQRGSGISFSSEATREAATMEQLIADTFTVTDYLRRRFSQDRIYLMGHSGGSFIGIQAVAQSPERYHAYIGVAQMVYQLESEKIAYDYLLEEFRARGDTSMVRRLEAAPVTLTGGLPPAYVALRDPAMHELGVGTMHQMRSLLTGLVIPSLRFPEYTLREKVNLWTGKSRAGISVVWDRMVSTDLRQRVTDFSIPVYFLEGIHDYTCNYGLARSYFERIRAPVKGFYTFPDSAHSPMFEEPSRMQQILRQDVLAGTSRLADRR